MLESVTETLDYYPECASYFNGSNLGQQVLIRASMSSGRIDEIAVALGAPFGMALWLGMAIQAAGVEIYVSTPIAAPSIADDELAAIDSPRINSPSRSLVSPPARSGLHSTRKRGTRGRKTRGCTNDKSGNQD
jgi:hypothetical protein